MASFDNFPTSGLADKIVPNAEYTGALQYKIHIKNNPQTTDQRASRTLGTT